MSYSKRMEEEKKLGGYLREIAANLQYQASQVEVGRVHELTVGPSDALVWLEFASLAWNRIREGEYAEAIAILDKHPL